MGANSTALTHTLPLPPSPLALAQAYQTRDRLKAAFPELAGALSGLVARRASAELHAAASLARRFHARYLGPIACNTYCVHALC